MSHSALRNDVQLSAIIRNTATKTHSFSTALFLSIVYLEGIKIVLEENENCTLLSVTNLDQHMLLFSIVVCRILKKKWFQTMSKPL